MLNRPRLLHQVTLVHVLFRGFPLAEFVQYVIAQTAGAFTGSLLVYGMYNQAINVHEGGSAIRTTPGTASLFVTFPLDFMNAGMIDKKFLVLRFGSADRPISLSHLLLFRGLSRLM